MKLSISLQDRQKIEDACKNGDVETLRAYHNAGVPIHIRSDDFDPLGIAVVFQRLEAARFLLECGAPVNWRRSTGRRTTPLMEAAQSRPPDGSGGPPGDVAMTKLLLDHGANPLIRVGRDTARTNCFNPEIIRLLEAAEIQAGGPRPIIEYRSTDDRDADFRMLAIRVPIDEAVSKIQSILGLSHHVSDICKHTIRMGRRSFIVAQFLKHEWTVVYGQTTDTRNEPVVDYAQRIAKEAGVETIGWINEVSPNPRIDFLATIPNRSQLPLNLVIDSDNDNPIIRTRLGVLRSTAARACGKRELYVPAIPTGQFEVNTDWHPKFEKLVCEDFERLDLMSQ